MTNDTATLTPSLLGFWTRCLRTTQHWSQDALAAASGLTTRTIQRIEAGEPSTISTRRSLARGLGYDNPDVFDDPEFARMVHQLIEVAQGQKVKDEYPDHIPLPATPIANGDAVGRLIGASEAYVFNCDDELPQEAKEQAASLFDMLQDYGDIWRELSHSDRLKAGTEFDDALQEFERQGLRVYSATRSTKIVGATWPDKKSLPITIGYLTVIKAEREIEQLMVPKGF
ncbi:MAG: helix-turn-helix transcriptional regulator [Pseudomonadota bacterium]